MTNKKFSDLTTTTTFTGTDIIALVQGGVSKSITATNFGAAIAALVPAASTSVSGITSLATNVETAAGTNTTKIVTPDDLRYGLANSAATKIIVNSATGVTNTGDINITGNFLKNGVIASGAPQVTPVNIGAITTFAITVDFTTYISYRLILCNMSITGSANYNVALSSNGGVGYITANVQGFNVANTTVQAFAATTLPSMSNPGDTIFDFTQRSTAGEVSFMMHGPTANGGTTGSCVVGGQTSGIAAACNRIQFNAPGNNFGVATYYLLIPTVTR